MKNTRELLENLLDADSEAATVKILDAHSLLSPAAMKHWRTLGDMPNNQSIVLNQQSTPTAALVEKITNSIDAILIRHVRARGIDPRDSKIAPRTMAEAVSLAFPTLATDDSRMVNRLAEDILVLYATGGKERPCLSLYDAGEGQMAADFPHTFCSLVSGQREDGEKNSYKGRIPFVQGRFNMGGTGVLPFCGGEHRFQLIVSRRPKELVFDGKDSHEWAFTLLRFIRSADQPGWYYLVGDNRSVLTAGNAPLALLPRKGIKSGEIVPPRERTVTAGTLIKMIDYKAPKSNICGELYKELVDFLLQPALPLRLQECRKEHKVSNVTFNVIWDRLEHWKKDERFEKLIEDGASFSLSLTDTEQVKGNVRVFKLDKEGKPPRGVPRGVRACINGQSHAKYDTSFFKSRYVDKEEIADCMLVTLDCTSLGQASRNQLFMSDRERFRDDDLQKILTKRLQHVLSEMNILKQLNDQRFAQRLANAASDKNGMEVLEGLLTASPELADLFGSDLIGKVAAPTDAGARAGRLLEVEGKFKGKPFPSFIQTLEGETQQFIKIQQGRRTSAVFRTDVVDEYFDRKKQPGTWKTTDPTFVEGVHLNKGLLSINCYAPTTAPIGSGFDAEVTITGKKGHEPFKVRVRALVVKPVPRSKNPTTGARRKKKKANTIAVPPSAPDILFEERGAEDLPAEVKWNSEKKSLTLIINTGSDHMARACEGYKQAERERVVFSYKFGLALQVMALVNHARQNEDWDDQHADYREKINDQSHALARIVVPIALELAKQLPARASASR